MQKQWNKFAVGISPSSAQNNSKIVHLDIQMSLVLQVCYYFRFGTALSFLCERISFCLLFNGQLNLHWIMTATLTLKAI